MVYLPSSEGAFPSSIEKEEVPEPAASNFPIESIPRTCFTSGNAELGVPENSSGTFFLASCLRALDIVARRPPSTPCTCATKPLSTRNT